MRITMMDWIWQRAYSICFARQIREYFTQLEEPFSFGVPRLSMGQKIDSPLAG